MDIRDVGAGSKGSTPVGASNRARSGSPTAKAAVDNHEVFFENSGRLGQVRALIDQLVQAPDIRPEVIQRGQQLLTSGQLDTPEAAAKAAEALLSHAY